MFCNLLEYFFHKILQLPIQYNTKVVAINIFVIFFFITISSKWNSRGIYFFFIDSADFWIFQQLKFIISYNYFSNLLQINHCFRNVFYYSSRCMENFVASIKNVVHIYSGISCIEEKSDLCAKHVVRPRSIEVLFMVFRPGVVLYLIPLQICILSIHWRIHLTTGSIEFVFLV
jgi:hypothetical protein